MQGPGRAEPWLSICLQQWGPLAQSAPMNLPVQMRGDKGPDHFVRIGRVQLSIFAAIFSGISAQAAILIARSGRFSGETRPSMVT
jgi:hypothetical protein